MSSWNKSICIRIVPVSGVPDAEHAVDVVPDSPAEHGGVHVFVHGHGVVGQVVGHLELLIQQLTNIRVQTVHQGVAVVLPTVVLKRGKQGVNQNVWISTDQSDSL